MSHPNEVNVPSKDSTINLRNIAAQVVMDSPGYRVDYALSFEAISLRSVGRQVRVPSSKSLSGPGFFFLEPITILYNSPALT
jgi:hypothetical protein